MECFLFCSSLPPSLLQEIPVWLHTLLLKMGLKTPLPLGNSYDLPWGGYGIFLELHMEGFCGKKWRGCKESIGLKIQTAPIYNYFGTQAAFNLRNIVPYLCFDLKVEICKNTSLLCLEKLNLLKCKVNDVFCSLIKLKQKKSTKYQVLWFYLFNFKQI